MDCTHFFIFFHEGVNLSSAIRRSIRRSTDKFLDGSRRTEGRPARFDRPHVAPTAPKAPPPNCTNTQQPRITKQTTYVTPKDSSQIEFFVNVQIYLRKNNIISAFNLLKPNFHFTNFSLPSILSTNEI